MNKFALDGLCQSTVDDGIFMNECMKRNKSDREINFLYANTVQLQSPEVHKGRN